MAPHGEMSWTEGMISTIKPDIVAGIVSRISDLALVISEDGMIRSAQANPNFPLVPELQMWLGRPIQDFLTVESIPKFETRLAQFKDHTSHVQPVQVNHVANADVPEFPIQYSFHRTGADNGILLLGNDLTSTAEMQQQLVAAHIALENDYENPART